MVEEVDAGPMSQEAVPVLPATREELPERLTGEHRLLVGAVADYFLGKAGA
jgi:hypothetical protein